MDYQRVPKVGDIVQIDPEYSDKSLSACLVIVHQVDKENEVISGYLVLPVRKENLILELDVPIDEVVVVGNVHWMPEVLKDDGRSK